MNRYIHEFTKGLYAENPVFRLVLGLCPTLAVTTAVVNGLGMGIATMSVLVCSNLMIALIRNFVPKKIRIPIYITVIATFVTIVEMVMQAFNPALHAALGIFVPLIVVNCIILGRAEAFASRNGVLDSIADALGIGTGFGLAILIISFIRQLLGTGELDLFGRHLFTIPGFSENPVSILMLPMGAFLVIGTLLALFKWMGVTKNE